MPTKRSRSVDDTHPVAKWLFQAADLGEAQTLTLDYASPGDAARAARSLRRFRDRAALAPEGTYEPSAVDPKGEGRGYFDHVSISYKRGDAHVSLRRHKVVFPEPQAARVG